MPTHAARGVIQETTSRLGFRDFNSSDYERLVEIYNANYPDYPTSVEETRYNDESSDKSKFVQKRFPCVDQDSGSILGFARLTHTWWNFHPQKFMVDIVVDPQYQRRGVGSRSYQRLTEELEKLHATTAWASVKRMCLDHSTLQQSAVSSRTEALGVSAGSVRARLCEF